MLLSQLGMRSIVFISLVLAIAMIAPGALQVTQDNTRTIPALDSTNITYCEVSACGYIEGLGLEVVGEPIVTEDEFGTRVSVQVVNRDRRVGQREFWAELRTQEGAFVEAMRGQLVLTDQGPQFIEFFFTGSAPEFTGLLMDIGY